MVSVPAQAGAERERSVDGESGAPDQLQVSLAAHFARISPRWRGALGSACDAEAIRSLVEFVDGRLAAGRIVLPPRPLACLEQGGPEDVRVLVLGQDPYHGPGQAMGFAFSVPDGVRLPPSLRNIFLELARETGRPARTRGNLLDWSRQGVLLLNAVLTVEQGEAASHAGRGWEEFTDSVIDAVARQPAAKVFFLWGAQAQAKRARIEAWQAPALVLCANHPSPLSARRPPAPFLGCGHFELANRYLRAQGRGAIDWG